jgi:hypothetical protein
MTNDRLNNQLGDEVKIINYGQPRNYQKTEG